MNQENSIFGYEVIIMIIVLVTTKEKSLGINFNQQNLMLLFRHINCYPVLLHIIFRIFSPIIDKNEIEIGIACSAKEMHRGNRFV